MHLLISGSLIATSSALLTFPAVDSFDAGLAGHFAQAIHASNQDCLSTDIVLGDPTTLVFLDELGGVTEVDLGEMPEPAMYAMHQAVQAPLIAALGLVHDDVEEEEVVVSHEVTVGLTVGSDGGTLEVTRDGDIRTFDLDDINDESVAQILHHVGMGSDTSLGSLMEMLTQRGGESHAEMVIEMIDDNGQRSRRVLQYDGDYHGQHDSRPRRGDDDYARMGERRGGDDDRRGAGGRWVERGGERDDRGRRGEDMMRRFMNEGDEGMMRQHMQFIRMMPDDPDAVWGMIEHLPPELRQEHMEIMETMMREGWEERHSEHAPERDAYLHEAEQFVHKIHMTQQVAAALENREAVAIFGVWQARAHMGPEERLDLLLPIAMDDSMMTSIRNAASWVVMEAQAELGNSVDARSTLSNLIRRNGAAR